MQGYYQKNRERILAMNRAWRAEHAEQHMAKAREYHHAHKDEINRRRREQRAENPARYRQLRHKRLYGLSPAEFAALQEAQGGHCAICPASEKLVVDHDHSTGVVRGLLCDPCNQSLGLMQDSPDRFVRAAAYVIMAKHKPAAAMIKANAQAAQAGVAPATRTLGPQASGVPGVPG